MPLELLPYQVRGADFLASRERAGLFDEPGLGKTAQCIAACDLVKARRILIVCPAAAREVWVGEFKKFAAIPRRVMKGTDIHQLNLWLRGRVDVLITSYEMAVKWKDKLNRDLIDVLAIDEAHYAKSSMAQRTRALLGLHCDGAGSIAQWATHAWLLTGTPMHNSPEDIWPFLRFTGGTPLTKRLFLDRYFSARQTQYATKYSPKTPMLAELQQAIKSTSIKRTKKEAGVELPPIWLTTQTVDGNTEEIRALLANHPGLAKEIVRAIEAGGLSFLDAQHIGTLRRLVGEAKAPHFAHLLTDDLLHGGLEKVVVMGIHKRALAIVREALGSHNIQSVIINGDTPEEDRGRFVERFQNDPKCRVFIGNIRAAGTALTLTAAADVIMLEASWAPADNAQAIMRVHRIGQTRQVRAKFISLANSIDEYVTETLTRKTAAIAQVEGVDAPKGSVISI